MNQFLTPKLKGYFIPNSIIALLALITKIMVNRHNPGTLIYSEFVIMPMLSGIMSAWFWRGERYGSGEGIGRGFISALIAIVLSFLFLGEGSICLVIVSPLLWCFICIGITIGKAMFKFNDDNVNISVLSLLLVLFFADATSRHHYENVVTDTVVINAPVSKVWPLVIAYKKNATPNKYWLFKIGMPSPVQSTTTGNYVGASRKCIFSNGYVFVERITEVEVNKKLTFTITNQPRDPEIMGHIDIEKGQFILQDNGNGTTTLIGNSWYQLHVFPVWYYGLWAESITRNVHLRVMQHIKLLSETE